MMIDQCGATVTVGFSREGHDWQEAPLLYREIRLSMAKSRLVADGQIVRYDDLEPDAFNAYRLREEFVPGLLERIETGDQERVSEYMARIMDALLTPEPESFSYAQAFGMSLLSELIRNLKWRNKPQDDANILMWRQMLDCGSADQIAALLTDYVEHYMRTEKKAHLHQQHHLVQNISQFIRERLHENWTVKQLANHFNLNASYLSVLFKKETGKSISEFVQETRIQRAKELLQDPSIKVYEVAERVGIQTTAYFAYLFKKLVGSTPQDYRDYHYTPDESSYRP
ncbi:HTH-type transcriptional activator Btr [compost metagenome]